MSANLASCWVIGGINPHLVCFKWLTWKQLKTCHINRCKIGVESSITLLEVLFGLVQSGFENFDWIFVGLFEVPVC